MAYDQRFSAKSVSGIPNLDLIFKYVLLSYLLYFWISVLVVHHDAQTLSCDDLGKAYSKSYTLEFDINRYFCFVGF